MIILISLNFFLKCFCISLLQKIYICLLCILLGYASIRRMSWSKFKDYKILVGVLLMLLIDFWGFVMLYGSYEQLAGCLIM